MEEKLNIIDSVLYTLEQIPVTATVDCERKVGIVSGLRSLRGMIQREGLERRRKRNRKKKEGPSDV